MDLFGDVKSANRDAARPLAARLRPSSLDDFVGQEHFLGEGKLLRRMLLADRLSSVLFYGPPGCGKTALAHVIAHATKSHFAAMNAVNAGTKELRETLAEAKSRLEHDGERTILFLDEIHRFNRTQQDVLLPDVEDGVIILVGATTQNPFFAVNSPLLSRSQVFHFEPLSREHVKILIQRALVDVERGLGSLKATITDDALSFLAEICDGDARRALTALEIAVKSNPQSQGLVIDISLIQDSIQRKVMDFDPTGDAHYDMASAFIKSLRGSDADAGIYWLARMLESGEDPRFIARRIVILASEDVGNADPQALLIAHGAWDAVEKVGLPECQLALAQAVIYLALAPKSNAATLAIGAARKDVKEGRTLQVPSHLRDKHYKGAERLGHGDGYKYAHDYEGGWVDQEYVPTETRYVDLTERGFEKEMADRLTLIRTKRM